MRLHHFAAPRAWHRRISAVVSRKAYKRMAMLLASRRYTHNSGARLIIGLGNPGRQYEKTRHNIGFMCVDELATHYSANWRTYRNSEVAEVELANARLANPILASNDLPRIYIAKPQTYMNLSGISVSELLSCTRVDPSNILVVQDDLHIPLGRVKFARGGSAGGHNGIDHIIQQIGKKAASQLNRMKVGIAGPSLKPGTVFVEYVLQRFARFREDTGETVDEAEQAQQVVQQSVEMMEFWAIKGLSEAMNKFNGKAKQQRQSSQTE